MRRHQVAVIIGAAGLVLVSGSTIWLAGERSSATTPQATGARADIAAASGTSANEQSPKRDRSFDVVSIAESVDADKQDLASATETILGSSVTAPTPTADESDITSDNPTSNYQPNDYSATPTRAQGDDGASVEAMASLADTIGETIEPIGPVDEQSLASLLDTSNAQDATQANANAANMVDDTNGDDAALDQRLSTAITNVNTNAGGTTIADQGVQQAQANVNGGVPSTVPNGNGAVRATAGVASGDGGGGGPIPLFVSEDGLMLNPNALRAIDTEAELIQQFVEAVDQLENGSGDENDNGNNAGGEPTRLESVPSPTAAGAGLVMLSLLGLRRRRGNQSA
jgi:hypothetical protein